MELKSVKTLSLIIWTIILCPILILLWSLQAMDFKSKLITSSQLILFTGIPLVIINYVDSIKEVKNVIITGSLAILGFAFMTIIPLGVIQSLTYTNLWSEYDIFKIATIVFWIINIIIGIKIIKKSIKSYKKSKLSKEVHEYIKSDSKKIKINSLKDKIYYSLKVSVPISVFTAIYVGFDLGAKNSSKYRFSIPSAIIVFIILFTSTTILFLIWLHKRKK